MISVCMAIYNGEKYIRQQLDSVLENIGPEDEVILSDDGSSDGTGDILKEYAARDERIRLTGGPGQGVIRNFEHAMKLAKGDYLYLADQDDLWVPGKVETVQKDFANQGCAVVIHDADMIDEQGHVMRESFFAYRDCRPGVMKNIVKNSYIGCCMALRRELLQKALPIPKGIAMHDQWIGVLAELEGGVYFEKKVLLHYRRHGENTNALRHFPVWKMMKNRILFAVKLLGRQMRRTGV